MSDICKILFIFYSFYQNCNQSNNCLMNIFSLSLWMLWIFVTEDCRLLVFDLSGMSTEPTDNQQTKVNIHINSANWRVKELRFRTALWNVDNLSFLSFFTLIHLNVIFGLHDLKGEFPRLSPVTLEGRHWCWLDVAPAGSSARLDRWDLLTPGPGPRTPDFGQSQAENRRRRRMRGSVNILRGTSARPTGDMRVTHLTGGCWHIYLET